ncbi:hypothetical protein AD943_04360 [Gluconobacter roseus]|nr:hypothetical protein AD943_04360 [Gluconobacter roseus]
MPETQRIKWTFQWKLHKISKLRLSKESGEATNSQNQSDLEIHSSSVMMFRYRLENSRPQIGPDAVRRSRYYALENIEYCVQTGRSLCRQSHPGRFSIFGMLGYGILIYA